MEQALKGKTALVTGGSRGIGKAVALLLARHGAAVVLTYARERSQALEVVAAIEAAGGRALALEADLTRTPAAAAIVNAAVTTFGRLDVLVNNAGVAQFVALDAIDEAHYARLFDTNVRGLLFTTQAAARVMTEGSAIVNVSSLAGQNNHPGNCVYSASKAAVDALTRTLGMELGPRGIRVNAVAPGMTRSEMMQSVVPPSRQEQVARTSALGRLGEVEDIAEVVLFLASDASRFMTGQVLLADGGRPR